MRRTRMADDDPELWHAIHRLATAIETLDGGFLETGGIFDSTDEHWLDEKSSGEPYKITYQNGKTLAEKKALLADLQALVKRCNEEIKEWTVHYKANKTDEANAKAKARREEAEEKLRKKHEFEEQKRREAAERLAKKQAEDKAKRDAAEAAKAEAEKKRREAAEAKHAAELAKKR